MPHYFRKKEIKINNKIEILNFWTPCRHFYVQTINIIFPHILNCLTNHWNNKEKKQAVYKDILYKVAVYIKNK